MCSERFNHRGFPSEQNCFFVFNSTEKIVFIFYLFIVLKLSLYLSVQSEYSF